MASSALSESEWDFNAVEEFDEYNPHPYRGGYDIALTYGQPLPQSSTICYPISSPPSSLASEPPPYRGEEGREPADRQGESEQQAPRGGSEEVCGSDSAGEDWGRGYGGWEFRGAEEDGGRPGGGEPYSGLFGYWSFPAQEFEERDGERDSGGQDPWNSAADYLFAYLHAYGEKRDESHNYGNLNYAYERHHRQEPHLIQFSPHEPSWCEDPSYHEDNQEEAYTHSGYAFNYGRDSSEVPHSDVVCVGSSWSPNSHHGPTSYHDDYSSQVYPQSECSYAYEKHYYEQPLSVHHDQTEHTWSQSLSFSEFYEGHVHPQEADMHTYGSKLYVQPIDVIDFIEKSWHQMLNNNESGEHDDSWDKSKQQSYFPFCKYSDYDN